MRKLYTIATVARAMGGDVADLERAVQERALPATKVAGVRYVTDQDAEKFAGRTLNLGAAEFSDVGKADERLACLPERVEELVKLMSELARRVTALEAKLAPRNTPPPKKQ